MFNNKKRRYFLPIWSYKGEWTDWHFLRHGGKIRFKKNLDDTVQVEYKGLKELEVLPAVSNGIITGVHIIYAANIQGKILCWLNSLRENK